MTDVIKVQESYGGTETYATFYCPGCKAPHMICVRSPNPNNGHTWTWNSSKDKPTFQPSVMSARGKPDQCHSYITDGNIQFLGDCTHALAGQTVPLPPRPWPQFDDDS